MFFLFGWKTKPKLEAAAQMKCKHCKHKTVHRFVSIATWFTLFFIPVIPLGKRLLLACNACGFELEFKGDAKKAMFEKLKAVA